MHVCMNMQSLHSYAKAANPYIIRVCAFLYVTRIAPRLNKAHKSAIIHYGNRPNQQPEVYNHVYLCKSARVLPCYRAKAPHGRKLRRRAPRARSRSRLPPGRAYARESWKLDRAGLFQSCFLVRPVEAGSCYREAQCFSVFRNFANLDWLMVHGRDLKIAPLKNYLFNR